MIIKLFQPPRGNWLIIAEQLQDPATWDRFVPCHAHNSDRSMFDKLVAEKSDQSTRLKVCKELLKRGSSAYEYQWDTEEDAIISHALEVADALGVSLEVEAPGQKTAC